jgi:hypothetical protein
MEAVVAARNLELHVPVLPADVFLHPRVLGARWIYGGFMNAGRHPHTSSSLFSLAGLIRWVVDVLVGTPAPVPVPVRVNQNRRPRR